MPSKERPVGVTHWAIILGGRESHGLFKRVSGLSIRAEVAKERATAENGLITGTHATVVNVGDITLHRGIDDQKNFSDWHKEWVLGEGETLDGSLELRDMKNQPIAVFEFFGAWPSKYSAPPLNTDSNEMAVETITITPEIIRRKS
jgi:phage tail-like protein